MQARILFLNLEYPTRALDAQPPLQTFPQARHSGRIYSPDTEDQILDMQRIYNSLQSGRWFRLVSSVGIFSLGGHTYNASTQFADQNIEIAFNATSRKLICLPETGSSSLLFDIQGLSKSTLMRGALTLPGYSAYQLTLPFAYPDTTL